MNLWHRFLGWFSPDNTLNLDDCIYDLTAEIYYKELAIQSCINLIAGTISIADFKTFEKGVEVKKDNYYLFNVEPNPNKSANRFWREVVGRLILDNRCLVIQQDDYFYVADSFVVKERAFRDYIFTDIRLGGLDLVDTYYSPQVFYFELHNQNIKVVIDSLYQSYGKLIEASKKHYKTNNARRGTLEIPTNYPQTEKAQKDLENLLNVRFDRFFKAEGGAVLPLTNGLKYEELISNIGVKGGIEGRDVRAFVDDIFDFVATGFQVPPALIRGNVADSDKAVDNLLTFCVNPIAKLIEDEINRKYYKKHNYLQKNYMRVDTSRIRAVHIKDIANALDVLVRIGAYSVDDCLQDLGREPLNTEWSKARWMTKNYEAIEQRLKGGD